MAAALTLHITIKTLLNGYFDRKLYQTRMNSVLNH